MLTPFCTPPNQLPSPMPLAASVLVPSGAAVGAEWVPGDVPLDRAAAGDQKQDRQASLFWLALLAWESTGICKIVRYQIGMVISVVASCARKSSYWCRGGTPGFDAISAVSAQWGDAWQETQSQL